MLCTTSPLSRSTDIGPRGLSQLMPFIAATSVFAVGRAAGLLQRFIDEMHAVISGDRHEICAQALASC